MRERERERKRDEDKQEIKKRRDVLILENIESSTSKKINYVKVVESFICQYHETTLCFS